MSAANEIAPALAVVVPDGWRLASLQLDDPSGQATLDVTVAAADGAGLDEFAAARAEEMANRLNDYASEAMHRPDLPGGEVLAHPFSWQPDVGPRLAQTALYRLVGGLAYVAVLTAAQAPTNEELVRLAELVARLDVTHGDVVRDYSTAELTALAEIAGGTSFPGTGEHAFASPEARDAAERALVARGTIRGVDGEGRAHLDPVEARLVSVAMHPDMVISVEHRNAGGTGRMLLYVTPGGAVAHHASESGIHRLESVPPSLVGAMVGRFTGIVERTAATDAPIAVDRTTFDRVRASARDLDSGTEDVETRRLKEVLGSVRSSSQVQAVPRGRMDGDSLAWLDCGDRGLWLTGDEARGVVVQPVTLGELSARFDSLLAPAGATP